MVTWKSDACASNSSRWGPDTVTETTSGFTRSRVKPAGIFAEET